MVVALLVAGVDRGGVDDRLDAGLGGILGGGDGPAEGAEAAADLADHHVPGGEADLAVDGVDLPGAGRDRRGAGLGRGGGVDSHLLGFPRARVVDVTTP